MSHMPSRMCVICRQRFAKAELTRHVLSETGVLLRDERAMLPGRGWYVCSSPACLQRFEKYKPGKRQRRLA